MLITGRYGTSVLPIWTSCFGEENRKRWLRTGKCSFLPEEREWMDRLLGWGPVDTGVRLTPTIMEHFSWFDYRSKGFDDNRGLRIDLLLASQPLAQRCVETGIDYEIRGMEKPSDHAPVWATFRPVIHALLSPPRCAGAEFPEQNQQSDGKPL